MDYFKLLNLSQEPFSNSPDPAYFFSSRQHRDCLQQLELSLRLRRGLCIVVGDVGTGKTTLCRQLIRKFANESDVSTHLILDPSFSTSKEFLFKVAGMFLEQAPAADADEWQIKETIKNHLFQKGVEEGQTIVLIIDEGQKLPFFCIEVLREFLNYETNEYKLLQIALFAQKEFENTLEKYANLADRTNAKYTLGPMSFWDTRRMIQYRLQQAAADGRTGTVLFSLGGVLAVYFYTGGYPRQIVNLCHQCLLAMIIQNRSKVRWFTVRACSRRTHLRLQKRWRSMTTFLFLMLLGALALTGASFSLAPLREEIPVQSSNAVKSIEAPGRKTRFPVPEAAPPKIADPSPTSFPAGVKNAEVDESKSAAGVETASLPHSSPVHSSLSDSPSVSPEPPARLGTVTFKPNETLWGLVKRVYGSYDPMIFQKVRDANPRIRNPDHVEIGQRIRLPAVPVRVAAPLSKRWWIEAARMSGLGEALDYQRRHSVEALPLRLVPHWNPDQGLHISVLLVETFADPETARRKLVQVESAGLKQLRLLSDWAEETLFYADPYG